MSDSAPDYDSARRLMVTSQLRPQGVTDARVLDAMGSVPREAFVPAGQQALAYGDRPLKFADGSPMMPPAELGLLLGRLAPVAGERALVVGGGGAYATALLRHIGLDVDTSDGAEPPGKALFDLILVEGAIGKLPQSLACLLGPGGRVGAAVIRDGVSRLAIGRSVGDSGGTVSIGFASFAEAGVPALPGFKSVPAFSF